ncbi:MAG: DUF882 domain-containing protein [Alphaproteobacteria bacterium]|nr:DUF882 domain-containing protein [Alphaproteobacteria bacterium]
MNRRHLLALGSASVFSVLRPALAVPPAPPTHRIALYNAHTGESFDGPYRDDKGPLAGAMDELSHFLRDHHSGARIPYDVAVLDFLAATMDAVGATRATILSAYRTPETNAMLARTTFGVADNSQHMYGRALDVRLDGRLEEAMQAARAMHRGGVGWYPTSHFMHIDSGPVRNWNLDGGGFDSLLFRLRMLIARSSGGTLPAGHTGGPLNVRQRLALHRMIAKAEFVARRH